ncbi:MAG: hypothetical protein R3C14_37930 [Caldilineaceae bacterium]
MDIGTAVGSQRGVTEQQLAELHQYQTSTAFDPLERLVVAYATALTQFQVTVPDELVVALKKHLSDRQLVELTSAIAWENYRARFNRGLGIEADGFMEGSSCVVPQRVPPTQLAAQLPM